MIQPTLVFKPHYVPGTELGKEERTWMKTDMLPAAVGDRYSIIIIKKKCSREMLHGRGKVVCVCVVFV